MSFSKTETQWNAECNLRMPEDVGMWDKVAYQRVPSDRGRWECPRCPLEVKWAPATMERVGNRLAELPSDDEGVSEVDLSLLPARLT
jgi:hypothetical protein